MNDSYLLQRQLYCYSAPIASSALYGVLFAGMDIAQGAKPSARMLLSNFGFIYAYNAMQCPMEAFTGRRSWTHNALSGAMLGGMAVHSGNMGIPFVSPHVIYSNPQIRPWMMGSAVFGGIAGAMGMLSGKPF